MWHQCGKTILSFALAFSMILSGFPASAGAKSVNKSSAGSEYASTAKDFVKSAQTENEKGRNTDVKAVKKVSKIKLKKLEQGSNNIEVKTTSDFKYYIYTKPELDEEGYPVSRKALDDDADNPMEYTVNSYDTSVEGKAVIVKYTGNDANVTIPAKLDNIDVAVIGGYSVFSNDDALETLTIPDNVIVDGNAGSGYSLKSLVTGKGCTFKDNAFSYANALQSANFGDGCTFHEYSFSDCSALETLTFGDGCTIKRNSFSYCSAIQSLSFGDNTVIEEWAFPNLYSDSSVTPIITYGKDVKADKRAFGEKIWGKFGSIDWSVITSREEEWDEDEEDYIEETSTKLVLNGSGEVKIDGAPWEAFIPDITQIELLGNFTKLGDNAFTGYSALKTFQISNSITEIGKEAFSDCTGLKTVEIPAAVTKIGASAFAGCTALTEIIFLGNAPAIEANALPNAATVTIYTPQTATGWGSMLKRTYDQCKWLIWDNTIPSKDIVLLLDVSGSMSGRVESLKKAANAFIEGMKGIQQNCRIAIAAYDDEIKSELGFTYSQAVLEEEIANLGAWGGTEYAMALGKAQDMIKDSTADVQAIIMFSDGEPNDDEDAIFQLSAKLQQDYSMFSVGLGADEYQREVLEKVAGDKERYFEAENIDGLVAAFLKLLKNINRKENTTTTLSRHNVNYDITVDEVTFSAGSDEYTPITIVPGKKLGDYAKVCILNGNQIVAEDSDGIFLNLQLGKLFKEGDQAWYVVYDASGKELERKKLWIKILNQYTVTFLMNDGTDTEYEKDILGTGDEVKEPKAPQRVGYDFKGWYATKACDGFSFFSELNSNNRGNISGDLTLYAKWVLSMTADIWSFTNSEKYFNSVDYEISAGDYAQLLKNLGPNTALRVKKEKTRKWGGSCFGMSSSVVLSRSGDIDIELFDNRYHNLSDAQLDLNTQGNLDVGTVESMINFYMLRQYVGKISDTAFGFNGFSPDDESDCLMKIVKKLKDTKEACMLDIFFVDYNDEGEGDSKGGHAVVAYDYSENENGESSFKVYDCSMGSDKVFTVTVKNTNGTYTAECEEWTNAWNPTGERFDKIFFATILSAADLKQEALLVAPSTLNTIGSSKKILRKAESSSSSYLLVTNYADFTISAGSKTAVIEKGQKKSGGTLDITCWGNRGELDAPAYYEFELPVLANGEEYKIVGKDAGTAVDSYSTLMYYDSVEDDGFCSTVEAKAAGTINVDNAGSLQTAFDTAVEQNVAVASNALNTTWNTIEVSATSKGLDLDTTENDATIKTADGVKIDVTVSSKFNEAEFKDVESSGTANMVTLKEDSTTGDCNLVDGAGAKQNKGFGYAVVFDSRQGTNVASVKNIKKGTGVTAPADPTRAGFIFTGWYKESDCKNKWDFASDTVTNDTILYAGWELDANYFISVTFKKKDIADSIIFITNGSALTDAQLPENVTWYTDAKCTTKWVSNTVLTKNTVLYAEGWYIAEDGNSSTSNNSGFTPSNDTGVRPSSRSGRSYSSSTTGGTSTNPAPAAPTVAPTKASAATPTPATTAAPTGASTKAPTTVPTEAPTTAPTEAPTEKPAETASEDSDIEVGTTVKNDSSSDKGKYIVSADNTVTLIGVRSKTANVTIPAKITVDGQSFKLTKIAAKAFKNNKKLKKITIGINVKVIDKNAFYGAKNLKTIVLKSSKITKVGKNAFKGINKNAVIKLPKKKFAKIKKLIKKSGVPSTIKYKKSK